MGKKSGMKLYLNLIKVEIKKSLQYKLSLFTELIGTLVGYVGNIIIYYIMFMEFDTLNGWSFTQTMFVYTFASLVINLSTVFFGHFISIDSEIVNGGFDKYMIRPISAFRYYALSHFNFIQCISLLFSALFFIYFYNANHVVWSAANLFLLFICGLGAVLINSALSIMIGGIGFWTKKSQELYDSILWPAQYLSYLPIHIFPTLIRSLFTFVIPLAFLSYYPSTMFIGKNQEHSIAGYLTPLIGIVCFFIAFKFWNFSLKKYESSGN